MFRKDIFGEELNIGNTVLIARYSEIYKAYVLGFTEKGIYLSRVSQSIKNYTWKCPSNDLARHNVKFYYRYVNMVLYEKTTFIDLPDKLKPLCNHHQIKE